jgi:hypothetical protein
MKLTFVERYFLAIAIIFVFVAAYPLLYYTAYPRFSLPLYYIFSLAILALSSPPLLSLLLLRRPSSARALLHAASALYTLVALPLMLNYLPPLVLAVPGAALVAGLPEAMAAGRWARRVYFAVLLFWLVLMFSLAVPAFTPSRSAAASLAASFLDPCAVDLPRACGAAVNASGTVWSPCSYTGRVRADLPIDPPSGVSCIAAGTAGGRTWVVLELTYWDSLHFSFPDRAMAYECCKKLHGGRCVVPLVAMPVLHAALVVNVEEGVGYYTVCDYPSVSGRRGCALNHTDVIFGDAVYINTAKLTGAPDKMLLDGALHAEHNRGCFLKMRVWLERDRLAVGRPLYNTTARAVRVG